jgi:hypothetical protein
LRKQKKKLMTNITNEIEIKQVLAIPNSSDSLKGVVKIITIPKIKTKTKIPANKFNLNSFSLLFQKYE